MSGFAPSNWSKRWVLDHPDVRLAAERARYARVLADVSYPGYAYALVDRRGSTFLQIVSEGRDNVTGEPTTWKSRRWLLTETMLDSEVVQTALAATLAAVEHEARENFTFRGRPLYDPHYDAERLWSLRGEPGAVVQRVPRGAP